MMLFRRSLIKSWYLFFLFFGILGLASQIWVSQPLITVLPDNGFLGTLEMLMPFLLLLPLSFLLHDSFEIELGLVCGVKTVKMMFSRFWALVFFALMGLIGLIVLFKYKSFYPSGMDEIIIPIHIPEHYRLYMIISVSVTLLFFSSLYTFVRVATKNCYASVGIGILVYTVFHTQNYNIRTGGDIKNAIIDPFISNYFLGNTVPKDYYGLGSLWTYNRIIFFILSAIMLLLTYILLRKEKLHEGFND